MRLKRQFFLIILFIFADAIGETNSVKLCAPLFTIPDHYHRSITTKSPLAQRYFNQGLLLFYGFVTENLYDRFKNHYVSILLVLCAIGNLP